MLPRGELTLELDEWEREREEIAQQSSNLEIQNISRSQCIIITLLIINSFTQCSLC